MLHCIHCHLEYCRSLVSSVQTSASSSQAGKCSILRRYKYLLFFTIAISYHLITPLPLFHYSTFQNAHTNTLLPLPFKSQTEQPKCTPQPSSQPSSPPSPPSARQPPAAHQVSSPVSPYAPAPTSNTPPSTPTGPTSSSPAAAAPTALQASPASTAAPTPAT